MLEIMVHIAVQYLHHCLGVESLDPLTTRHLFQPAQAVLDSAKHLDVVVHQQAKADDDGPHHRGLKTGVGHDEGATDVAVHVATQQ